MAGGTFDKLVGKVRPGTYINFLSTRHDTTGISDRGIVIIPLINHNWGPTGEFISLDCSSPDAAYDKLGYSIYDTDANNQMLLIREAFKKVMTVLVYRINGGTAATATSDPITATVKYKGSRGNSLSFAVVANPVSGFDVSVYLDGSKVTEYDSLTTVEELIAEDNPYITFSGTGDLVAIAGVTLSGGEDTEAANADITTFLDSIEGVKFNVLCFPITDSALQAAAKTKIKYMRENIGKGVQVVMPDTASDDYEGVINVTNSVKVDDVELTNAQACAWVAAATAAAKNTQSNTYVEYEGATEVVGAKSHEDAVEAINNGEFFFSVSEAGAVVIEYDINTLVTFADGKDKTYRKNRVIRVFDTFAESLQVNFPPNKYDNNSVGWDIMEGIGRTILKQFEDAGAITDVDYDNDFLVDRGTSSGDETFFNVGLQPVDSTEKLYFTIATR
ncbi:MAG: phage tail sheath family protein [Ruminococcus sp.]|nr:phage tail sheath family protein [Ruminococcus sp.]